MQIQLLLFGIIADLIGKSSLSMEVEQNSTIGDLKKLLIKDYPQMKSYTTFAVALNEAYALDDKEIQNNDVIALIPPVSGG